MKLKLFRLTNSLGYSTKLKFFSSNFSNCQSLKMIQILKKTLYPRSIFSNEKLCFNLYINLLTTSKYIKVSYYKNISPYLNMKLNIVNARNLYSIIRFFLI